MTLHNSAMNLLPLRLSARLALAALLFAGLLVAGALALTGG